ncbi:hypothetical protein AACH10_02870 [Ideonella sp. DXS22W]|uniref:Uncharacterized protein n=1 Tax=Pseudaquabacterium inlustre TaxID=2984192 RepID=A0ABU9CF14_9BURK
MLRLTIHAGLLAERNDANHVAVLDIAYQKRAALADYLVALSLRHQGELEPAVVANYPRWSGSLWDLCARGLTRVLYKSDLPPPIARVDRRCAYATKLCATIQRIGADERGVQLASAEIVQPGRIRGQYQAVFQEDILGTRKAEFTYGCKFLNPADLVLRAICFALFGDGQLGKRPKLVLPASTVIEGKEVFDIEGLEEPARTGFIRHRASVAPLAKPEPLPLAQDYVDFLMRG